jgi:ABC-type glycerol-3-phosphate transport system permease component
MAKKTNYQTGSPKVSRFFASYGILLLVSLFLMIPVFLLVTSSLKTGDEFRSFDVKLFPSVPQWRNYIGIFRYSDFLEIAVRTGILSIVFAGITTLSSSLTGYAFARYRAPGSKQLFIVVVSMLIIPIIATIIPQYILYARLGMINTYWPWILSALAGTPLYIFLFRQFFLGFPKDLEDAAEVDGCSPLRLYAAIFLPNAKPAIATVMIFAFMSVWGDYFTPLIFLNPDKTLLGVALANYFGRSTGVLAATVLYILPVVVVFFFAQKYILQGVVTTGLKG